MSNRSLFHVARTAALAACACLALATARADGPELVDNGGFESGDFTGWTTTPSNGASLFGVDDQGPHNGTYAAYFGSLVPYDVITQTLATAPGAHYTVSLFLDSAATRGGAAGFIGSFGGATFLSLSDSDADFIFQPFVFDVVATAASTLLSFSAYNNHFFYTLDDVSVRAVTVTPVPEPETYGLMLVGLGALAALRRRQSRLKG